MLLFIYISPCILIGPSNAPRTFLKIYGVLFRLPVLRRRTDIHFFPDTVRQQGILHPEMQLVLEAALSFYMCCMAKKLTCPHMKAFPFSLQGHTGLLRKIQNACFYLNGYGKPRKPFFFQEGIWSPVRLWMPLLQVR